MPIEFEKLSMMDLRSQPGTILDAVSERGKAYLVERNGQQKACLVPISFFLPDIQVSRITKEMDKLIATDELFRVNITSERELQLLFEKPCDEIDTDVVITLPHGYPNNAPTVMAENIDEASPHRWKNGTLCIYGVMDSWNPGKNDIADVLKLARRWLENYHVWKTSGDWPNTQGDHGG